MMNNKKTYIAPHIKIVPFAPKDAVADFIVSSKSVGEDEALSKQGEFDIIEEDLDTHKPWGDVSF